MTAETPHNAPLEVRERRRERRKMFLRFFSIVFSVYGLINFYIFWRLNESIPSGAPFSRLFPWLFWFVSLSYFVGQYFEHKFQSWISDVLTWIGAFWLGMMTWYFLAVVIIDLVRLLDWPLHFLPQSWYANGAETKLWIAAVGSADRKSTRLN